MTTPLQAALDREKAASDRLYALVTELNDLAREHLVVGVVPVEKLQGLVNRTLTPVVRR
jgi:hypothetical protein